MPDRPNNPAFRRTDDIGRSPAMLHRILSVLGAFFAILVPACGVILLLPNAGRGAWDATVYHEPFIRALSETWPRFDLSNPLTATTPGYHILLSTLGATGIDSTTAFRVFSALIGATLIATLAGWHTRRGRPLDAFLLSLPVAASIYTFQSAAFLLPDNLGWLGVLILLALCLADPPGWRRLVVAGVVLTALVFTRQIHLWAAAVIWTAAWLGVDRTDEGVFKHPARRMPRSVIALLITVPAFGVVAWFVRHWGGAVPPRFQGDMHGGNPATPAFILLQTTILMFGFGPWLMPAVLRMLRDQRGLAFLAAAVGLALAILPATSFDPDAGRYSGWWAVVRRASVLFGRTSLAMLVLAPIGALLIVGAATGVSHRARWTLLGALVAFATAQSATAYAWQRYHEPFLIILLGMLATLQSPDLGRTPLARLRVPAMLGLCVLLAAISVNGLRGPPVEPGTRPPAMHTDPSDPWFMPPTTPTPNPEADPES